MPVSRPCQHCGKVKRCALWRDTDHEGTIIYLCRPCARVLGYHVKEGE